jgi:ATP-binding protein involved in chromosome partitioning
MADGGGGSQCFLKRRIQTPCRTEMKKYRDIPTDGGSDVIGQVLDQRGRLDARMMDVRRVVAVMSGKGGVGKSAVTVGLASALAIEGHNVGILDADFNGASVAKMTGVLGQQLAAGETGVLPAIDRLGLRIMSVDLFLPDQQTPVLWDAPTQKDAFAWRGLVEAAALRELVADTEWGRLDYLFVDLPPGSDKLPNLVDVLPQVAGAVVVTIPAAVSLQVVGRSVRLAREVLRTPVIGLIQNMAGYVCTHCGREEHLFASRDGEAAALALGIPYLGRIPFDPRIGAMADDGVPFLTRYADTPAGISLGALAGAVHRTFVEAARARGEP